jgi:hypothetical protein
VDFEGVNFLKVEAHFWSYEEENFIFLNQNI